MDAQWFKQRIEAVAANMGGKRIMSARQLSEPDAQPSQCFANVDRKVARDGGFKVLGWTPHWRVVEAIPGPGYLFLTHHAVWVSGDGYVIDVTPYPDPRHAPLSLNAGYSPFIIDPAAVPDGHVSLPLRFIALDTADARLVAHVEELSRNEEEHYRAARTTGPPEA